MNIVTRKHWYIFGLITNMQKVKELSVQRNVPKVAADLSLYELRESAVFQINRKIDKKTVQSSSSWGRRAWREIPSTLICERNSLKILPPLTLVSQAAHTINSHSHDEAHTSQQHGLGGQGYGSCLSPGTRPLPQASSGFSVVSFSSIMLPVSPSSMEGLM